MSDPTTAAPGATGSDAATNPSATASPSVAAPAAAQPAQAAQAAAPTAVAVAAPAAPAPPAAEPPKRFVNPHARIAAKAASGQATSAAVVADLGAKYTQAQATIEAQTAALKAHADTTLASLTDSQRAAVTKRAGADPLKQLEAVALLREAGALNVALPALANTAPATQAPSAAVIADADVAAYLEWKAHKDAGRDLIAARLSIANHAAIKAGEAKHASKN